MDIPKLPFINNATTQTDIYTNLHGLQSIKNEENQSEALKKVAQQFEALFVNMMTKSMREANAVFSEDNPFESDESLFYRDMLDQQRALSIAHGRGLGIAKAMYRQLSHRYGYAENLFDGNMAPVSRTPTPPTTISDRVSAPRVIEKLPATRAALSETPQDFIKKLLPLAEKAAEKLGVDRLLLIAQSALETGWGKHVLAAENGESSHNVFNVKGRRGGGFETTTQPSVEFKDGIVSTEYSAFKVYKDIAESFDDYVNLIRGSERYQKAIDPNNSGEGYIQELHKAGYATDPRYSDKVLAVYERVKKFAIEIDQDPQKNHEVPL